jgi:hypothetical protein
VSEYVCLRRSRLRAAFRRGTNALAKRVGVLHREFAWQTVPVVTEGSPGMGDNSAV